MAADVVQAVRAVTHRPVIPKLSPNVTDIVAMAQACQEAGADAVSMINTVLAMAIDVDRERPVLANVFGGLSGPAIRPVAVRMVWEVHRAVRLPIIGMGGIRGPGMPWSLSWPARPRLRWARPTFTNPLTALEVLEGIEDAARQRGPFSDMIGRAHRWEREPGR